jgi:NAD(P)-dependent dehydrogenase (short-subunit alcohol dehydrogenase family)
MSTTNQRSFDPKSVLVTGASGLLGVASIEKFLAAGWEVMGVSRSQAPRLT